MKKVTLAVSIVFAILIIGIIAGAYTKGAPSLVYVYSDSMEPLIKVNDAFVVWPSKAYQVGDIVMYRPAVLDAALITHRIIGLGNSGWITKGDNSASSDQDSGEPQLRFEGIIGKVLTINGQPLVIPYLGKLSASIQASWGAYARYLALGFLALAILNPFIGRRAASRRRKPQSRLRLKHIYKGVFIGAIILFVVSIYLGSRVAQVKYLVSEYSTNTKEQVAVNQPGNISIQVRNNGLVPVWPVAMGISPLGVSKSPTIIWPQSAREVQLEVLPQRKIGFYQGYVQIYNYPTLMPRTWIIALHQISPIHAITATTAVFASILCLGLRLIGSIRGLEGWMPVKALKDKLAQRQWHRLRTRWLSGRRRRAL